MNLNEPRKVYNCFCLKFFPQIIFHLVINFIFIVDSITDVLIPLPDLPTSSQLCLPTPLPVPKGYTYLFFD